MLKVLKIKVNGYKLLEENFEIDLTTKARVYNDDTNKEIATNAISTYVMALIIVEMEDIIIPT